MPGIVAADLSTVRNLALSALPFRRRLSRVEPVRWWWGLAILPAALALAGVADGDTTQLSPEAAIAGLNATRAANGIPGNVVLKASWSKACQLHNRYKELNHAFGHTEQRSGKGYTAEGLWASQHAVIWYSTQPLTSWQGGGPWQDYPYHQFLVLAPQLAVTGFDATSNLACMIVNASGAWREKVVGGDRLYVVPRNGATGVVSSFKDTNEFPRTPAGAVGLRGDATTGPSLYVYADGPWARCGKTWCGAITVVSATSSVAGKTSQATTVRATHGSQYPYPSQILVPVKPLLPHTKYNASVKVRIGKKTHSLSWSFTTA
jgi:hypothetical protein